MQHPTLAHAFFAIARAHPDRPALCFTDDGSAVAYGELAGVAAGFAERFRQAALQPGDVIALPCDRSLEFFGAFWGAWLARLSVALLNPTPAPGDLLGALERTQPRVLAGREATLDRLRGMTPDAQTPTFLALDAQSDPAAPADDATNDPADDAVIVLTSGTTGRPKGVRHSHHSLLSCVQATRDAFPFADGAVILSLLPHDHLHGLLMTVVLPVLLGGSVVVAPTFGPFVAPRVWDFIREFKVNHFSAVPGVLGVLADFHARLENPHHEMLRFGFCASAPLSAELRQIWFDRIGCPIANNYGLSEAASWVAFGSLDRHAPQTTVGKPSRCVIEIFDDQGNALPPGRSGEVTIKGEQLMRGYLHDPERTAQVLRDGRLFTGDLGHLDEEGRLYLEGRKVETINTGGLKVNPVEIEEPLRDLDGVGDIVAFGWPDSHLGEIPAVAVVADGRAPTLAAIRRHLQGLLTAYKMPRKCFVVDQIPRNALGKVQRLALQQRLMKMSDC